MGTRTHALADAEIIGSMSDRPTIADGVDRRLDPRVIPLRRTVGWISTACIAGISLVAVPIVWIANDLRWMWLVVMIAGWAIVVGALAWLAHRWPAVEYHHTFYHVDEQGIEIRQGVYWRAVINVPRSRVQHTDVSQGPLERSYALGTLVIYTAGTDHARVTLSGLAYDTALHIREHLLPRDTSDAV
jgi:membrane protein YdbS with pleckstrin-like domain